MYEHKSQPMLSRQGFAIRLGKVVMATIVVVTGTMVLGAVGFSRLYEIDLSHGFHHAAWLAMGEHDGFEANTPLTQLFEGGYLLFVRLVLFSSAAFVVTPIFHRIMHKLHLDDEEESP